MPATERPVSSITDSQVLSFKLIRREKEFELEGHDGTKEVYVAKELTGPDRETYYADLNSRYGPLNAAGKRVITNFKNLQSSLIALCLYYKNKTDPKTGQPTRVPIAEINLWPVTVLDAVFKLCQELSGVDDDKDESVKKDSTDLTETGF